MATSLTLATDFVSVHSFLGNTGAIPIDVHPETKTLGQMPIVVAGAAHWVMGVVASATVLYLGRVWRDEFRGILIWGGVAGLWLWVYYFLNLTLILREGFAI